jgi:hypothetical protein
MDLSTHKYFDYTVNNCIDGVVNWMTKMLDFDGNKKEIGNKLNVYHHNFAVVAGNMYFDSLDHSIVAVVVGKIFAGKLVRLIGFDFALVRVLAGVAVAVGGDAYLALF